MKKSFLILGVLLLVAMGSHAQTRKYISQFNQLQSYFNPSLTGYEGSIVRGFVRNQWSGFDGAPQTYFVSAELDPAEMRGYADAGLVGNTAVGFNLLHDVYGPFIDTEILLNYGARIRISRGTNLRLGIAANYNMIRLDGNNLSTEQASDPTVGQYLNSFANMSVLDFNAGLSLTSRNYYVGYAIQNISKGKLQQGDAFLGEKPFVSVIQTGFRQQLSSKFTLYTNLMYRYQPDLPMNLEMNIRTMIHDRVWLGVGHRVDYANNFQIGMLLSNMRFGYAYEVPLKKSYLLPYPTHEFMASFFLFKKYESKIENSSLIW